MAIFNKKMWREDWKLYILRRTGMMFCFDIRNWLILTWCDTEFSDNVTLALIIIYNHDMMWHWYFKYKLDFIWHLLFRLNILPYCDLLFWYNLDLMWHFSDLTLTCSGQRQVTATCWSCSGITCFTRWIRQVLHG